MSKNVYQVGLIGFGLAGSTFHAPVISAVPGLQLAAVASSQEQLIKAAYPDVRVVPEVEQLLRDPALDLIVIAAPNEVHFPLARAALLAGKHVVVDKPFTLNRREAAELIACAAQQQKILSVYHNRRWDGDFLTLQALLASGRLGRISLFESRIERFRPQVRARWREQALPGAGLLYDLGPHLLDQALCLFGMPQRLFADLALQREQAQAVDYCHLVLYYEQAALRVVLHASALCAAPSPRFALHGTQGSFVSVGMDGQEDALRAGGRPGASGWGLGGNSARLYQDEQHSAAYPLLPGCYQQFYLGMREAMAGRAAPPVSMCDAELGMTLIDAALHSAAEGRIVDLRDINLNHA